MLLIGLGKEVPAVVLGHKVQIARVRRFQHGTNRVQPRVTDRPGRQPRIQIRVVGRLHAVEVLSRKLLPAIARLVAPQGVLHGRVGLQRHVLLEPVQKHAGDDGSLIGGHRLALDDGGQRHDLIDREAGFLRHLFQIRDAPVKVAQHDLDHVLGRSIAGKLVGIREQKAFQGSRGPFRPGRDIRPLRRQAQARAGGRQELLSRGDAARLERLCHLLAAPTFQDGHRLIGQETPLQARHDIFHGHVSREQIRAHLDIRIGPVVLHQAPEHLCIRNQVKFF